MTFLENEFGFYYKGTGHLVFFGKTAGTLEKLQEHYPQLEFMRIKQTHSDICVEASKTVIEADAHITQNPHEALIIATADCIPLMIYCQQTNRVAGVHAGWKGVVNGITMITLLRLIQTGSTERRFNFYFGPHILQASFEVGEDVFKQLEDSNNNLLKINYAIEQNAKFKVNLNEIVLSQITSLTQKHPLHYSINLDTKTDARFYSYRRGKLTPERNLSFIALV